VETETSAISLFRNQGRSDGGISVYIPPTSVYLKCFYVVVLSPWPIYTRPNQIPGYAPVRNRFT